MTVCVGKGRAVGVFYLDSSSAFGMVCHNILGAKLGKCGLDGFIVSRMGAN